MERLMQFAWQHRLGLTGELHTVDGRRVRIIDQGLLNTDSGPDFFNASIQIDDEKWVGNIEIHVRASDWHRHHHDNDPAYDNVILHVVGIDDAPIKRRNGTLIPQLVMNYNRESPARCNQVLNSAPVSLPCADTISELPQIYKTDWITALAMERLYQKSERIIEQVKATNGYWESAAYETLARGLGFGLNSQPFETLARNLPLRFLNKQHDELITVEALLFGSAGLIPDPTIEEDSYVTRLRTEYQFLAKKFDLHPLPLSWKMARTRPQNFPHRRLGILSQMIHEGFYIIGRLDNCQNIDDMRKIFDIDLRGFWANHYNFNTYGGRSQSALSESSVNILLINVAIPLAHARAMALGNLEEMTRIAEYLQQLPAEDNAITRMFATAGIKCEDAFTSQALVQLRREYCEKKKCIYCRFGHRLLSRLLTDSSSSGITYLDL